MIGVMLVALAGLGVSKLFAENSTSAQPPSRPIAATPRAAVDPAPSAPPVSPASSSPSDPASVVQAYYNAINDNNWNEAWNLGGDNISAQKDEGEQRFIQGFAGTAHDNLTVDSVSGDDVSITLHAEQSDGSCKGYQGDYIVDMNQGAISSATLWAVSGSC